MQELCVSVAETQRLLGLGKTSVYKEIAKGNLQVVKIGRRTLVKTSSIRAVAGEQGGASQASKQEA